MGNRSWKWGVEMREILFRGKRLDNGEWVEGFYVHLHDTHKKKESHRIYPENAKEDFGVFYLNWFEVDPATAGQYTGLTDKNGKKIFEGDIIEIRGYVYCCCWDEGNLEFMLINEKESFGMGYAAFSRMNVIGNVHDNPKCRR